MLKVASSPTRLIGYSKKPNRLLNRVSGLVKKYVKNVSGANVREAKKNLGQLYTPHYVGLGDVLKGFHGLETNSHGVYKNVAVSSRNYKGLNKAIRSRNIARGVTAIPLVGAGAIALSNKDKDDDQT